MAPTKREYLIHFKNQSRDSDEWIAHGQFNATDMLRDYWKTLCIPYKSKKPAKKKRILQVPFLRYWTLYVIVLMSLLILVHIKRRKQV
jgi:hypothetical protein